MSLDIYSAADFRHRALNQVGAPLEHAWRDHGDHILTPESLLEVEGLTGLNFGEFNLSDANTIDEFYGKAEELLARSA